MLNEVLLIDEMFLERRKQQRKKKLTLERLYNDSGSEEMLFVQTDKGRELVPIDQEKYRKTLALLDDKDARIKWELNKIHDALKFIRRNWYELIGEQVRDYYNKRGFDVPKESLEKRILKELIKYAEKYNLNFGKPDPFDYYSEETRRKLLYGKGTIGPELFEERERESLLYIHDDELTELEKKIKHHDPVKLISTIDWLDYYRTQRLNYPRIRIVNSENDEILNPNADRRDELLERLMEENKRLASLGCQKVIWQPPTRKDSEHRK